MRIGIALIGVVFVLLGILSLAQAYGDWRFEADAPSVIPIQEAQVRDGLRDPSDVWSRFRSDAPYVGSIGLNSPAALAVRGCLSLIAGAGILLRRRWAMLLGVPLLLTLVIALDAVPKLVEQVRQGNQPGSFAAIGVPMFGLLIVLPAVASIVLLYAALARGGRQRWR